MVVNYLKEVMKDLSFETVEDFCYEVSSIYEGMEPDEEFDIEDLSIIAKYEEATKIISELIRCGYDIHSVNLEDPEYDGYDDEFIISLCNLDGKDLWCEPMVRKFKYINDESKYIYIMDNCSSNVLDHLQSDHIYEVHVDEFDEYEDDEYDCCCDCYQESDECCGSKHEESELSSDDKHEVSNIKESYKVNGKEVSKDEYDKVVKKIEDKYLANMKSMLNSYSEFMEDLHDWHKMLNW